MEALLAFLETVDVLVVDPPAPGGRPAAAPTKRACFPTPRSPTTSWAENPVLRAELTSLELTHTHASGKFEMKG